MIQSIAKIIYGRGLSFVMDFEWVCLKISWTGGASDSGEFVNRPPWHVNSPTCCSKEIEERIPQIGRAHV